MMMDKGIRFSGLERRFCPPTVYPELHVGLTVNTPLLFVFLQRGVLSPFYDHLPLTIYQYEATSINKISVTGNRLFNCKKRM